MMYNLTWAFETRKTFNSNTKSFCFLTILEETWNLSCLEKIHRDETLLCLTLLCLTLLCLTVSHALIKVVAQAVTKGRYCVDAPLFCTFMILTDIFFFLFSVSSIASHELFSSSCNGFGKVQVCH